MLRERSNRGAHLVGRVNKRSSMLALYISRDNIIAALDDVQLSGVPNFEKSENIFRMTVGGDGSKLPNPEKALTQCVRILKLIQNNCKYNQVDLVVIGIPSPIYTFDQDDLEYGRLGQTYDPSWRNVNVRRLWSAISVKHGLTIDHRVIICSYQGAFALGEFYAKYHDEVTRYYDQNEHLRYINNNTLLFLNVDSTLRCSVIFKGQIYRAGSIPEVDHMILSPHSLDHVKWCNCNMHQGYFCASGILTIRSLQARWHIDIDTFLQLKASSRYLFLTSTYISQVLSNLIAIFGPTQVIVSGRIFLNEHMLPSVRTQLRELMSLDGDTHLYPGYCSVQALTRFLKTPSRRNSGVRGLLYVGNKWAKRNDHTVTRLRPWP